MPEKMSCIEIRSSCNAWSTIPSSLSSIRADRSSSSHGIAPVQGPVHSKTVAGKFRNTPNLREPDIAFMVDPAFRNDGNGFGHRALFLAIGSLLSVWETHKADHRQHRKDQDYGDYQNPGFEPTHQH